MHPKIIEQVEKKSARLIKIVRNTLLVSDDLRISEWRGNANPYAGHCYVAAECLYHLLGGKKAGLVPAVIRINGTTHWFLKTHLGTILDPTADQFDDPVNYSDAKNVGFLTRNPSKRAQELIFRVRETGIRY